MTFYLRAFPVPNTLQICIRSARDAFVIVTATIALGFCCLAINLVIARDVKTSGFFLFFCCTHDA